MPYHRDEGFRFGEILNGGDPPAEEGPDAPDDPELKGGLPRNKWKSGGSRPVNGCTDPNALNYNPNATADDGTCEYFQSSDPGDPPDPGRPRPPDPGRPPAAPLPNHIQLFGEFGGPLTDETLKFTEAGQTKTITAQVLDDNNDIIPALKINWNSTAPGLIRVESLTTSGNKAKVTSINPTATQVVKIRATHDARSRNRGIIELDHAASFPITPVFQILGCTDPDALNYNPNATTNDGTCEYPQPPVITHVVTPTATELVTEFDFVVNLKFNCDYNQIPIRTILARTITELMQPYFEDYYDQLRYGKTLLNFDKGSELPEGMSNEQLQIINWKRAGGNKVALRLKNVLPTGYQVGRRAMVVREIQNPVFDVIKFLPVEVGFIVPELRPAISTHKLGTQNKVTGRLVDLIPDIAGGSGELNVSSSYSNFVSNQVLENYYNVTLKSMEINADYSNFENFVTFGSAQKRIDVFKAKLDKIQDLIKISPVFVENLNISGSAAESGSYDTVFGTLVVAANGTTTLSQNVGSDFGTGSSAVYDILSSTSGSSTIDFVDTSKQVSKQIQELVRNFDGYESELWFESNLPYSASDESNFDRNNQYKADYTYPKILGLPLATTHDDSSDWYDEMSAITTYYDANNKNRLTENIPDYLWDDEDSVDFVTFTDLIGHHFDNIKIYIKNLENLSSRYPKIDKEISAPMAANVIQSFGVSIPSISSVEGLVRYISGDNTGSVSYKKIADEYYNRYVHALPFLLKSKGTKQSINSLLNVFGINPNLITVRESLKGAYTTIEPVKVTTTEQDFGLNFNSGSWLVVPFSASLRQPKTIQARFSLLDARNQTILNFEPSSSYRLNVERHPSAATNTYYTNTGRLDLVSGSTSVVASDYFDVFDENPVSVQLKYDAAGVKLNVRKIENEETTVSQSLQESAPSMSADWGSLSHVYIGSPAKSSSVGYHLSASLDEFRLWGEQINDGKFVEFAENPGMFAGNTYSSSLQNLYVRLSFNLPNDVEDDGYVHNTTPYKNKDGSEPGTTNIATIASSTDNADGIAFSVGSSPMYQSKRSIRTVIENSYKVGSSTRTTDMIRIAPAPPLSGSLSRTSTLTHIDKKFQTSSMGSTNVDISISPLDAVDRDVIRSYGNINLGDFIGRGIDRNADNYPLLDTIEQTFVTDLAPTIDYNAFIRFFDKFLHLFGETIKDYFPARAKITDGIVIRSPILNRNKLRGRETIKMGGENTRRTNNAITSATDKDVIRSFDPVLSITSSFVNDLQADYSSVDSSLSVSDYTAGTTVSATFAVSAEHGYDQSGFNSLNGSIVRPNKDLDRVQRGDGSFPTLPSVYGGDDALVPGLPPISYRPIDDFTPDNVGAYTYFAHPTGLTYIDAIRYLPVTQSWMLAAPNVTSSGWIRSNSYNLGDVVLQPIGTKLYLSGSTYSSGSDLSRNGKYYVCQPQTNRASAFQSMHPPQIDVGNWVPLKYNSQWYQKLARFAYVGDDTDNVSVLKNIIVPGLTVSGTGVSADTTISSITNTTTFVMSAVAVAAGTVDLTFTDSDGNSFVHTCTTTVTGDAAAKKIVTHVARYDSLPKEYTRKHFIFFRDNSIGARRRTYEGTLNTATTTVDVGQPFEVFDINVQTIRVGGTDRASGGGGHHHHHE